MCLANVTRKRAKIAKEDIVCYKVLILHEDGMVTIWREFPVKIGVTYTSKLVVNVDNRNQLSVSEGLHSYGSYLAILHSECIKVKCVIPKGARYYEGTFIGECSYASNKLKYVKIIE